MGEHKEDTVDDPPPDLFGAQRRLYRGARREWYWIRRHHRELEAIQTRLSRFLLANGFPGVFALEVAMVLETFPSAQGLPVDLHFGIAHVQGGPEYEVAGDDVPPVLRDVGRFIAAVLAGQPMDAWPFYRMHTRHICEDARHNGLLFFTLLLKNAFTFLFGHSGPEASSEGRGGFVERPGS